MEENASRRIPLRPRDAALAYRTHGLFSNQCQSILWQEETCYGIRKSHIYRPPFTWEEIWDIIKLFSGLKDFTDKYPGEFRAATRKPEWKKLYQLLPSNKKSSIYL